MKKAYIYYGLAVVSFFSQVFIPLWGFLLAVMFVLFGERARRDAKRDGYADESTLDTMPGVERDLK